MNKISKIAIIFSAAFVGLGVAVTAVALKDDIHLSIQAEKTYTLKLDKTTNMVPDLTQSVQDIATNYYNSDYVQYPVTTADGNGGIEMVVEGAFINPDGLVGLTYNGRFANAYLPNETYHGAITGLKNIVVNYTGGPLTMSYAFEQDMAKADYRVTSQPITSGVAYTFDNCYPSYFAINSELLADSNTNTLNLTYIKDITITYSCSSDSQVIPTTPYYDSGYHAGAIIQDRAFEKTVTSNVEAARALEEAIARHYQVAILTCDYEGIDDAATMTSTRRNFSHCQVLAMDNYSQTKGAKNMFALMYAGDTLINNDETYQLLPASNRRGFINHYDVASYYTNTRPGSIIPTIDNANIAVRKAYNVANSLYRPANYNDFPIEKRTETIDVYNSEDLWWAAQHGYKPNFVLPNSKAEWIYNEAKKILNSIMTEGMTNFEKARAIYEWIITTNDYDFDALNSSRGVFENTCYFLEGVFERKLAVCDGLSKTFVLLGQMEGLDVIRGVGYGNGSGHAWGYFRNNPNEDYYLVCPTWGEARLPLQVSQNNHIQLSFVDYNAFMTGGDYFYEVTKGTENEKNFIDLNAEDLHIAKSTYLTNIYSLDKVPGTDYDFMFDTKTEAVEVMKKVFAACKDDFVLNFAVSDENIINDFNTILEDAGSESYRIAKIRDIIYGTTSYTFIFLK